MMGKSREDRCRKELKNVLLNNGGMTNCYLTRGNGIVTLENATTDFTIEPNIKIEKIREIMRRYKVSKIEFQSPLKSDWGVYFPFIVIINDTYFYNLMS